MIRIYLLDLRVLIVPTPCGLYAAEPLELEVMAVEPSPAACLARLSSGICRLLDEVHPCSFRAAPGPMLARWEHAATNPGREAAATLIIRHKAQSESAITQA